MAQIVPPGIPADGSTRVAWVPTIADLNAPTLLEITATGSVDLSCYLTTEGFAPDATQDTVTESRLCLKQDIETPGKIKFSLGDLEYVYDPQNPDSVTGKAYAALEPGLQGYLVARWGKDSEAEWATGDVVDVYPVQLGARTKQRPEANSSLKVKQKAFVTGQVAEDVKVA